MDRHINTSCIEKKSLDNEKINFEENLNRLEEELKFLQIKLNNTQIEQQRQHKVIEQEKERKRDEENKTITQWYGKITRKITKIYNTGGLTLDDITNKIKAVKETDNIDKVYNLFLFEGDEPRQCIDVPAYAKPEHRW